MYLIIIIAIIVAAILVSREPKSLKETEEKYKDYSVREMIDLIYDENSKD